VNELCASAKTMKKGTELFIGSFIYPLLVAGVMAVFTLMWSKLATGDWLNYLFVVPQYVWLISGGVLLFWLILVAIYKRVRKIRADNIRLGPVMFTVPAFGYEEIGEQTYKGVLWTIRVPAQSPWSLTRREIPSPSDIDIGTPPRCPQCKTELEERKTFWGRYLWTCPRCDFSKKNSDSFYTECDRVEKIARRDFREYLRRNDRNNPGAGA